MDSCHIFNFIFGGKKATTELSRAFSNIGEAAATARAAKSSSQSNRDQDSQSSSHHHQQPPRSPFKQLQNRFNDLVSKVNQPQQQQQDNDNNHGQRVVANRRHVAHHEMPSSAPPTPSKPTTLVKPLPPKAPPNSFRVECIRHQLRLKKPTKLQQLFQDDDMFLVKFFDALAPLERCSAAQVCRKWRDILYSDHKYWKGLINVIDCTQLRREQLVECIVNTLQSAKLKQQQCRLLDITSAKRNCPPQELIHSSRGNTVAEVSEDSTLDEIDSATVFPGNLLSSKQSETLFGFDHVEVWKIQEICNRFALQRHNNNNNNNNNPHFDSKSQSNINNNGQMPNSTTTTTIDQQQMHSSSSKTFSIPSQISSTFSSASLTSILSPLSESSRIENLKEKLYTTIDSRGFDAICLFGATDDDIEDLVCKIPSSSHERITTGRLNNCSITNSGLDRFVTNFHMISELELTGCNELTNAFDLTQMAHLRRLIITDCINIADGLAQKLMQYIHRLTDLTIQAYHLTDAFIEFLSMNCDTSKLERLELVNCKEITNQSLIVLAKHFSRLDYLSISGSTKISDDGIEILAEQASKLRGLDLSWCPRITDASLECIACELTDSLTELVLDRNVNITDIGLGYVASMKELNSLQIRWCARVTDSGIESLFALKTLRYLSLAGIHQITARSLLGLVELDLEELELTNCPAVNDDLVVFLSTKLPKCNIIS